MQTRAVVILVVIFGAIIAFGIFSRIKSKSKINGLMAMAWTRLFHLSFTIASFGFVYLFFAIEGITLLSMRFILIIILFIGLIWLAFIIKYSFIEVPKKQQTLKKKEEFNKYIP